MNDMALEWQNVTYTVRQGFWLKPCRIIDKMNLSVPHGTVTGLIGPNGAGKTTTIKLGAGLMRADGGLSVSMGATPTALMSENASDCLPKTSIFIPICG